MSKSRWFASAVLVVAASGVACTAGQQAPQPSAPISPPSAVPTDQDAKKQAAYLDAIEANGGGVGAVPPARLISLGQDICSATSTGSTDTQVTSLVMAEGYSKMESATLIKSARQTLCS